MFKPASGSLPYKHISPEVNDFKITPLMPSMISYNGPHAAKADINGDALEDLYICGAQDQAGKILVQSKDGSFVETSQPEIEKDAASEDMDAIFFDADKDGDQDLYVVSGGYNFEENDPALQDRLYFNVNGKFRNYVSLPKETLSGSCVRAADIDNDGDLDLFVGTRVVPGKYPESSSSLLLINNGKGEFTKAPESMSHALDSLGMVTDAGWCDANNDGKKDLLVCGEWMKMHLFVNKDGKLIDQSDKFFKESLSGWWNRIHLFDADGDGDLDLVAGNWGLNSPIKVSKKEPAMLYYSDFDNNGSVDPIICYYIQGKLYPMASRDEMTDQIVGLRQKFPTYTSYSNTTLEDILSEEQIKSAKKVNADFFETTFFENDKGVFTRRALPIEANFFPVYAIQSGDFNHDGKPDIIIGGNTDRARIKIGKIDAGYGMLLKGDGKGNFEYVHQLESGLKVKGCIRDIVKTGDRNAEKLIFTVNNEAPQVYSY